MSTAEDAERKAERMKGLKASFRLDPLKSSSRVRGEILEATYTGVDTATNLHDFKVRIRGKSGTVVTIQAVESFMVLHRNH